MTEPLVSIIILNMNGKRLVEHLVSSIKKSTYKNIEIILADNASTDGSQFLGKKLGIKVIHLNNNTGTGAYNPAFKKSKGEFVVILGNDMDVDKNAIKILVEFIMSHPSAGLAMPRLNDFTHRKRIDRAGNWMSRSFYGGIIKNNMLGSKPAKIPYGIGMLRRSAINQFGYIMDPEYFLYAEDLDLGARFWIAGWEVWYIPDSMIYHMGSVTSTKVFANHRLTFLNERNMLRTYLTTLKLHNILLLAPYVYGMRFVVILRDIFLLQFKRAAYRFAAIFWPFLHIRIILKKRRLVQKNRKKSDSVLLSVCSERFLFSGGN